MKSLIVWRKRATKTGIVHSSAFDAEKVINPFTVHLNNKGQIMTVVSDGPLLHIIWKANPPQ